LDFSDVGIMCAKLDKTNPNWGDFLDCGWFSTHIIIYINLFGLFNQMESGWCSDTFAKSSKYKAHNLLFESS
jgi:hypothetical protein